MHRHTYKKQCSWGERFSANLTNSTSLFYFGSERKRTEISKMDPSSLCPSDPPNADLQRSEVGSEGYPMSRTPSSSPRGGVNF